MAAWAEALGFDWPLTHALVAPDDLVESRDAPRQAPEMSLTTVRALEEIAIDKLVAPYKRAFAEGILLAAYASLGFPDVQRIRKFGIIDDSVYGGCATQLQDEKATRPISALGWPSIGDSRLSRMGTSDHRHAIGIQETEGADPSFAFVRLGRAWELISADDAPYSTTLWKLAILCVAVGGAEGGKYTRRPPKNLFPTAANQLSFDQRELSIIDHWSSTSKMPERYDRSACANGLLLRDAIVQRARTGWGIAPSFRLPLTGAPRIGRDGRPGTASIRVERKRKIAHYPTQHREQWPIERNRPCRMTLYSLYHRCRNLRTNRENLRN